jgi:hypothetical protein
MIGWERITQTYGLQTCINCVNKEIQLRNKAYKQKCIPDNILIFHYNQHNKIDKSITYKEALRIKKLSQL